MSPEPTLVKIDGIYVAVDSRDPVLNHTVAEGLPLVGPSMPLLPTGLLPSRLGGLLGWASDD
jgi:hypothetical protein